MRTRDFVRALLSLLRLHAVGARITEYSGRPGIDHSEGRNAAGAAI